MNDPESVERVLKDKPKTAVLFKEIKIMIYHDVDHGLFHVILEGMNIKSGLRSILYQYAIPSASMVDRGSVTTEAPELMIGIKEGGK